MRSETVGNEQKHAVVKVIEREYQTLTWEQSSFADGKADQLVGRRVCTDLHSLLAPEFPSQQPTLYITLVPCFLTQIHASLFSLSFLFPFPFFPSILPCLPLPPSYKSFPLSSLSHPSQSPIKNLKFLSITAVSLKNAQFTNASSE